MRPVRRFLFGAISFLLIFAAGASAGAQPVVPVSWIKDVNGRQGYVILDIREEQLYRTRHIPGAINYPYVFDAWRVRPLAGQNTKRSEELFNARMSEIGIANDSHVVLVHPGRNTREVAGAAFVYWHFKLLGHENISILDGGMVAYVKEDAPLETMHRDRDVTDYKSRFKSQVLARLPDVQAHLAGDGATVDYRTSAYFFGVNKLEEVSRYGTLPGAKNLPADWLTIDGGGYFRPREHLRRLYEVREIPVSLPHVAFSSTSELAALGWFVASEMLGNKHAQLYEGSLREWSANPNNRMQRVINLD